jgi:hypothetical protein
MGSIRVRKDGKTFVVDENATGAELKRELGLPPNSILVNARTEMIADNERIGSKVRDGEEVGSRPNYKYWNW